MFFTRIIISVIALASLSAVTTASPAPIDPVLQSTVADKNNLGNAAPEIENAAPGMTVPLFSLGIATLSATGVAFLL